MLIAGSAAGVAVALQSIQGEETLSGPDCLLLRASSSIKSRQQDKI